jgi:taurine dioxygenase
LEGQRKTLAGWYGGERQKGKPKRKGAGEVPVLRTLSPIAGAEILGVDLRDEVPDDVRRELREALHKHSLLLFRDQELTPEQQLRTLGIFGEVCKEATSIKKSGDKNGFSYISNVDALGVTGDGPLGFHLDNSFYAEPIRGIMLYAMETPPAGAGGDTLFSNVKLAYQRLPAALREQVDGLMIRHQSKQDPAHPAADHPLAYKHPDTGETVLFMSQNHVDCILGVSAETSAALIEQLAAHIQRPEIMFSHAWRPKDLVIWDNIALQHARTDFDPKYRRHLRKLMLA